MQPDLTILLVTDSASSLRGVLRSFRTQGDPGRLEIVIAAFPGTDTNACAQEAVGFEHFRVVEVPTADVVLAEAMGTRVASAPYVCFALLHVYPSPGFVDAMIAAQRSGQWTAVGPAMTIANPKSLASRAGALMHIGEWINPRPRGPVASVPGHLSCYDREALLALGDGLEEDLDAGPALQDELAERGGRFLLEPAARVEIVVVSRIGWFFFEQMCVGANFASKRRRSWSPGRRAVYALGSPLIPFVRFARILSGLRRHERLREALPALPLLWIGLVCNAVGELLGYAVGNLTESYAHDFSLHRSRYVRRGELE